MTKEEILEKHIGKGLREDSVLIREYILRAMEEYAKHSHQEQLKGVTDEVNNPSRDYNHLYKLISKGKQIIPCFVDHTFRDDSKIYRDVACVKMRPDTTISIGVRGIQYGGVDSWHLKDNNGLELFIIECERLNLEFYKN